MPTLQPAPNPRLVAVHDHVDVGRGGPDALDGAVARGVVDDHDHGGGRDRGQRLQAAHGVVGALVVEHDDADAGAVLGHGCVIVPVALTPSSVAPPVASTG